MRFVGIKVAVLLPLIFLFKFVFSGKNSVNGQNFSNLGNVL